MTSLGDPLQRHDCTPGTATALVRVAAPAAGQVVVEPGPGTGLITARMLERGAVVHAIELDPLRLAVLEKQFAPALAAGQLHLRHGDAAKDLPRLSGPWLAVGNPPFHITSALLQRWLLNAEGLAGATLLLQREAAKRLCGVPGQESRWSVLLRAAGTPRIAQLLPRHATQPPSRVDLAILHWTRRSDGLDQPALQRLDRLLERAFAGTHTVAAALRGLATPEILRRQAKEQRWDPQAHPRTVPPAGWIALADFLGKIGKI